MRITEWLRNNGGSVDYDTSTYRKRRDDYGVSQGIVGFAQNNPQYEEDFRQQQQKQRQERQQKQQDRQQQSDSKVDELVQWSKAVRESNPSKLGELQKKSQEFQQYFTQNRSKYNPSTLNAAQNILKQGNAMLQKAGTRVLQETRELQNRQTGSRLQPSFSAPNNKRGAELIQNANTERNRQGFNQLQPSVNLPAKGSLEEEIYNLEKRQKELRQQDADRRMAQDHGVASSTNTREMDDVEARLADLRQQNAQLKQQQKMTGYRTATLNQADYPDRSQYQTTANGKQWQTGYAGKVTETGFDDVMYDYINKNPYAVKAMEMNASYGDVRAGTDNKELQRMTDEEVGIFNYLYSQDRKKAMEYVNDIRPTLLARQAYVEANGLYDENGNLVEKGWNQFAEENPVFSSILSVPNNLASSWEALIGMGLDKLQGNEIDPNAGYLRGRRAQNAIRGTVGEMAGNALEEEYIKQDQGWKMNAALREGKSLEEAYSEAFSEEQYENLKESNIGQKIKKFGTTAYGSIMSRIDNLFNLAAAGGVQNAALILMSTTAMPDKIVDAKEKGLSDTQAFSLGVIAAMAEYVTEKVSLEALLDMDRIARDGIARYLLVNGITEGTEEVASDAINFAAEQVIAKGKSEFNIAVDKYEAQGMSHEEALKAAWADQIEETAYSFIGGALAGGGAAAGFSVGNQINQNRMAEAGAEIKAQNPDNAMIQRMGDAEVAQFAYDQQAVKENEEIGVTAIEQAAEQMAEGGIENVNPALTQTLMQNPNALDMLEEATGSEEITDEQILLNAIQKYAENEGIISSAQEAQAVSSPALNAQTETSIPLETRAVYDEATARTSVPANTETAPQTDGVLRSVRPNIPTNVNPQLLETGKTEAKMDADFANVHALAEKYEKLGMSSIGVEIEKNFDIDNYNAVKYNKAANEIVEAALTGKEMPDTILPVAMADTIYKTAKTEGSVRYGGQQGTGQGFEGVRGVSGRIPGVDAVGGRAEVAGSTGETNQEVRSSGLEGVRGSDTKQYKGSGSKKNGNQATARSLGLKNGTDDNVVTLKTTNLTPEEQEFSEMHASLGNRVHYFTGGALSFNDNGKVVNVRGAIVAAADGTHDIYVRADDANYSGPQIGSHETRHSDIDEEVARTGDKRSIVVNRRYKQLVKRYGIEVIEDAMLRVYKDLYADTSLKLWEVKEEMLADLAGGMNELLRLVPHLYDSIYATQIQNIYEMENERFKGTFGNTPQTGGETSGQVFQSREFSPDDISVMDQDYMKAVENGDMETAQRMVDEAAKAAGWRQEHMFHGSLAYGFNVFDKAKAHVGGNSGAGFYFSSSEDDSDSHYADIEGADNFFKAQSLAERIVDAGEWDGIDVTDYDKALEIAKKELDKSPGTYNVYLKYDNPFIRDFGNSTNLYDAIMDDFDESTVDRDDYENDDDYEQDLYYYQWEHFTDTLDSAIRGAYSDIEDMYDVEFGPYLSDLVDRISGKAIDYQSLGWKDLVDAIEEENGIMVLRDDWDTDADASSEFARAIIENLGFDAIVDYEVSKKFGQLSREMMDDTYHTIVFKPNQIKSAGPLTLDDNGEVIPLSKRFSRSNDIRYSQELNARYLELAKDPDANKTELQRMVADAAKSWGAYLKDNNQPREFYHGTNNNDFTVFDSSFTGFSSGDAGFFGRGFYFAFSAGEARYYGRNIKNAYLKLNNPFVFGEELNTYNGTQTYDINASSAVFMLNFSEKFPEIAKDVTVNVVEKGNEEYTEIPITEFAKKYKDIIENKEFEISDAKDPYTGDDNAIVHADPKTVTFTDSEGKEHSFVDYGFQQQFYSRKDAENKLTTAYMYLANNVYDHVDMYNSTHIILDNSEAFTDELKKRGYDGVLQYRSGDEAVVFESNQIKLSDPVTYDDNGNVIPLSERFNTENQDIRYSRDSEGRELSKGQQKYFKESKVRDAEGNLLTVYHGSPATDITVFDRGRAGEHAGAYSDRAIWFTANKKFADDFSYEFKPTDSMFYVERGAKGRVYPGYLNIVNPFDLTNPTQEMKEILYRGASEIYKDPETKINELLEIGNHQLLKKYLDFDELEAAGYDGIIAKLDVKGSDLEYGIFNSNQAKDVNNLNPTDDQDIRYSIETKNFAKNGNLQTYTVQRNRTEKPTDATASAATKDTEDRTLSFGQQEFFRNSKMRDENGNLIVMYHGTLNGGFTVFDPTRSKDNISLFFTNDKETALTYTHNFGEPVSDYYEGISGRTIYPVYLNLTNPLIIDAKGEHWSRIQNGDIQNLQADRRVVGDYVFLTNEDYQHFNEKYHFEELQSLYNEAVENGEVEYNGDTLDEYEMYDEMQNAFNRSSEEYAKYYRNNAKTITAREFFDNYQDYGWWDLKSFQDNYDPNGPSLSEIQDYSDNDYEEAVKTYRQNFEEEMAEGVVDEDFLDTFTFGVMPKTGENYERRDLRTTREYARQAYEQGYDGLIIKNVVDRIHGSGASTVAVAFNSDQVKAVDNLNPTHDPDIRYSQELDARYLELAKDPEANREELQRMVEQAAKEAGYTVRAYHGTADIVSFDEEFKLKTKPFYVFNKNKNGIHFGNYDQAKTRMFQKQEQLDGGGYVRQTIFDVYLNLGRTKKVNDVGTDWTGEVNTARAEGYNSLTYKNAHEGAGESYAVFDSEQIKSADPVTYDDDGNVIPLSERFNPENNDIRLSRELEPNAQITFPDDLQSQLDALAELREQYDALQKENKKNARRAEYFKGETKLNVYSKNPQLDTRKIDRAAKALVKDYGLQMELPELKRKLLKYAEDFHFGGKDFHDLAMDILPLANEIVRTAKVIVDSPETEILERIKKTKIKVSEKIRSDIPDYGSFRKEYFGIAQMSTLNGTPVEDFYRELQDAYGMSLFPDEVKNPTDQLYTILETASTLQPKAVSPFGSYELSNATQSVALDIMNDVMSMTPHKTFADKQVEARNRLKKQMQAQAEKAIQKVRDNRDKRIQDLKDHYKEMAEQRRIRKAESEDRKKLLKISQSLNKMKMTKANRARLDEIIGELDLTAVSITAGKVQSLKGLKAWYDEQFDDPDFLRDTGIEKAIARLEKMQIKDMDIADVRELTNILKVFEHKLRTENKLIKDADRREVFQMGQEIMDHIDGSRGVRLGKFDDIFIAGTLSPERAIHRMTDYWDDDPLYRAAKNLSKGQRDSINYTMQADAMFHKWTSDRKFIDSIMGKKAEMIQIAPGVEITPAMRMSLYLHAKNDDNMRHIQNGGVRIPDAKLYKKGDLKEAYAKGKIVKFTRSQIQHMAEGMSAKERAAADAIYDYFNRMSQEAINDVSEALYGYSLAEVENYFPINTDKNYTRGSDTYQDFIADSTIEGMGFLKSRIKANNPIMLRDAFEVLTQSINDTAKFVGLAIPVRNFKKLWNVQLMNFDEEGNVDGIKGSVKDSIDSRWRTRGNKYISDMLADLEGSFRKSKNPLNPFLNKVRSNYVGAVLTLNLSVSMKQAASYPTAAAVLGWGPLIKALGNTRLSGKVDTELIKKYTPLLYYRMQGYSTQELGDIHQSNNIMARFVANHKALNWIQAVDIATTKKLWKASEYYVRDNYKDLEVGTDEYYRQVADIYNQVIEETQPNYTTMQRPDWLRVDDALLQSILMFKTQPFQNFNVLYDAVGNFQAKSRHYAAIAGSDNKAAVEKAMQDRKLARKKLNNAVSALLVSTLVFAAMSFAYNMLRRKKDNYSDEEGNLTAQTISKGIGKDMVASLAGLVPFGTEGWELLSSMVLGEKYYGLDSVTIQALSDFAETSANVVKEVEEIINTEDKSGAFWQEKRVKLGKYAGTIASAFGVPLDNVSKLISVITGWAMQSKGKRLADFYGLYIEKGPSSQNKKQFTNMLLDAYSAGDMEAYQEMYDVLVRDDALATEKTGTEDYIADKIKPFVKEEQKQQSRSNAGLTEAESKEYDRLLQKHDTNKDKQYSQKEIYSALMEIDLGMKQKEALWNEYGYKASLSEYGKTYNKEASKQSAYEKAGITEAMLNEYKSKRSGTGQDDTYNALMSMDLTRQQRETLWNENGWKTSFAEYPYSKKK